MRQDPATRGPLRAFRAGSQSKLRDARLRQRRHGNGRGQPPQWHQLELRFLGAPFTIFTITTGDAACDSHNGCLGIFFRCAEIQ